MIEALNSKHTGIIIPTTSDKDEGAMFSFGNIKVGQGSDIRSLIITGFRALKGEIHVVNNCLRDNRFVLGFGHSGSGSAYNISLKAFMSVGCDDKTKFDGLEKLLTEYKNIRISNIKGMGSYASFTIGDVTITGPVVEISYSYSNSIVNTIDIDIKMLSLEP